MSYRLGDWEYNSELFYWYKVKDNIEVTIEIQVGRYKISTWTDKAVLIDYILIELPTMIEEVFTKAEMLLDKTIEEAGRM